MTPDLAELTARARALVARTAARGRCRAFLGITGPPGAGKSTLAAALVAALDADTPGLAVGVPMDGFHLAQVELARLGRVDRKGAPDTFDAAGYVALLRRLHDDAGTVYAPAFRRDLEEPLAGAVPVEPAVRLVVTEGNYLLVDDGDWAAVRLLLDEVWYVDTDPARRVAELVQRHEQHGRSPAQARRWVERSDEPNARLVADTAHHADLRVLR